MTPEEEKTLVDIAVALKNANVPAWTARDVVETAAIGFVKECSGGSLMWERLGDGSFKEVYPPARMVVSRVYEVEANDGDTIVSLVKAFMPEFTR